MKINGKEIGRHSPTYFIAEIGSNYDGDLERAKDLIKIAADSDADAVKFQHYTADSLVSDKGFESYHQKLKLIRQNGRILFQKFMIKQL